MLDLNTVGTTAVFVVIMIIVFVFLVGFITFALWTFFKWKKYQEYECIIFERDGLGMLRSYSDRAGVFVDNKTSNKRLFLKKANVGLCPDNIPYVPMGNKKIVYLYRFGLKNFKYVNMKISDAHFDISVGEEDVNWAINAYERQKKMFSQSMLMAILPYAALIFVSIIILLMFIYFFKDFAVLKEVAIALRDAAVAMAQASGTTIITGT